jgi:hypothetical protein
MLFREIIAVYSEKLTTPITTICGQNAELKEMVQKSYHSALKSEDVHERTYRCLNL